MRKLILGTVSILALVIGGAALDNLGPAVSGTAAEKALAANPSVAIGSELDAETGGPSGPP